MTALTIIVACQLATIVYLAVERRRQHELNIRLIGQLCQRIQAPELAIAEHTQTIAGEHAPPAVALDDDGAHWEAKEQLAQRLQEMELRNRG